MGAENIGAAARNAMKPLSREDLAILSRLKKDFRLTELYIRFVLEASKEQLEWLQELGLIALSGSYYMLTKKGMQALETEEPTKVPWC